MAEKIKAVIIGDNGTLGNDLQRQLSLQVDFVGRFDDVGTCYTDIKALAPEAVFIHLDRDTVGGLGLARHLKNSLTGSGIFLLSGQKDPDAILEGLRIGVADFLELPASDGHILRAVQKAMGRAEAGGRSGKITTVFSMKGGQGVTSLAANLTDHIQALTGDKILLVDLNLFTGDVSAFLELPSTFTPFDLIKDLDRIDEDLLFSSLTRHPRGFYFLTAPDEISDADQVNGGDISRLLRTLVIYLDHIIIDLPHDFTEKSLAAIESADTLLLLVQQSMPVIKSVQKALKLFEELGYDDNKVKVVLNRYMPKNELTIDDISYVLNWPVLAVIANDFAALTDVTNKGQTLDMMRPDTTINQDMEALAGLLTGIKPQTKPRNKGWRQTIRRYLP